MESLMRQDDLDRPAGKAIACGLAVLVVIFVLLVSPLRADPQADVPLARLSPGWDKMDLAVRGLAVPTGPAQTVGDGQQSMLAGPGISGKITANGLETAGVALVLRMYDSGGETSVLTTTTSADGSYLFSPVPTLPGGKVYYVRFGPNETNPTYVGMWYGRDVLGYVAGQAVPGGDYDIGNITLQSPASGATRPLPATFGWALRSVPSDGYQWVMTAQGASTAWSSEQLGYVSQYTLPSLPSGALFGTPYYWFMFAWDGSRNSFGFSYYTRQVTLAPAQTPTTTPIGGAPTATRTPTATMTRTSQSVRVWLPVVALDYLNDFRYFEGPWEVEPNDTAAQANGPLRFQRDYYGHPDDQRDYYYFYLSAPGRLIVDMTVDQLRDMQMQLFRGLPENGDRIGYAGGPPYHIEVSATAGWYYVLVYTDTSDTSVTAQYTLRVTYP
jgi:hypothetical protein